MVQRRYSLLALLSITVRLAFLAFRWAGLFLDTGDDPVRFYLSFFRFSSGFFCLGSCFIILPIGFAPCWSYLDRSFLSGSWVFSSVICSRFSVFPVPASLSD